MVDRYNDRLLMVMEVMLLTMLKMQKEMVMTVTAGTDGQMSVKNS